jgi:hypothetical protein
MSWLASFKIENAKYISGNAKLWQNNKDYLF